MLLAKNLFGTIKTLSQFQWDGLEMQLFRSLFYVTHIVLLATYMLKVSVTFTKLPVTITNTKTRTFLHDYDYYSSVLNNEILHF